MRLRTLPVSIAGVILAVGISVAHGTFKAAPAFLCLAFAILAQIVSNFANEYYDFKGGLDKAGRVGPRRGVTEGDITPTAMRNATFGTLALACAVGLSLVYWGGLWLIIAGIVIALGALAYSTGPYPLSHHGLGELAVVFFFGIIPVNLTCYVQSLTWDADTIWLSVAAGLMGANVLIVNNYRDMPDDRAVGKMTLAVKFGRRFMHRLYIANAVAASLIAAYVWPTMLPLWASAFIAVYLFAALRISTELKRRDGVALNPLLGMTAVTMLGFSLIFLILTLFLR
jgi:1,4-dihydroxy-2-naphthoate octaprenyltransferase